MELSMLLKQTLYVCLILVLFINCSKNDIGTDFKKWRPVIKELELISISDIPDSVKSYKIQEVFQKSELTITDYEEFYRKTTRTKQLETIRFLKDIEATLSTEMQEDLQRLREEAKNDRRTGSFKE
jgi:hypothetical protein